MLDLGTYFFSLSESKSLSAKNHGLRVFIPSTIGAYGPTSQLTHPNGVPDIDIQRCTSFYGIHKVFVENMGENYLRKFGVDFRCLRFPGEFEKYVS